MNPVQVLILITKANWGGAQRYVFDLATRLPKDRFKAEVMTGGGGPLVDKLWEAGIPAHGTLPVRNNISFSENFTAFFKLFFLLRKKKPDVLHLNSSQIGILGSLAGRLTGIKRVVFTIHGWAFNEDRSFLLKAVLKFFYWLALMLCHETIAVSHAAKNQVRNWPGVGNKITVIHNGIGQETPFSKVNARFELAGRNPALKKALEAAEEKNTVWVGTIAELHHIKGYEYALKAIHGCLEELKRANPRQKIIYVICGEGEERAKIESYIEILGLRSTAFLLGHVDNAAQYLKAFDIFLLASLSEGLGYVLLEAGAAQTAVVATAVGGIPEVVEDMSSGILVQPKNHRELAHALSFMIEHPDDRRKYAAELKERVAKKFSLEEMVKKTGEVYEKK